MTENEHFLSLADLRDGDVVTEFDKILKEIAADILNPEKIATSTRKVSLDVIFVPGKDRDVANVVIKLDKTLGKEDPMTTTVFVGRHRHGAELVERNPKQTRLFEPAQPPRSIRKEE